MDYKNILVTQKDFIGIITLNRPECLNSTNVHLAVELCHALESFENNSDIRVIILKGAGKGFCSGVDINDLKERKPLDYYKDVDLIEKVFLTISNMGKPVIASVHKIAAANGAGIVAACDLAIAAGDTKFGLTAVNIGLFCTGPAVPVSRNVGRKKALELLITGDLIDAHEAERIGLINKVVPIEDLEEETMNLARKIASKSPIAVQLGKKSFYNMSDLEYSKALEIANKDFAMLCTAEDTTEGINAFLEKRSPVWKMK